MSWNTFNGISLSIQLYVTEKTAYLFWGQLEGMRCPQDTKSMDKEAEKAPGSSWQVETYLLIDVLLLMTFFYQYLLRG